jgi:predicted kinase
MNDGPAKPRSLIVLTGPPGAGKTTVAAMLVQRYPLAVHLPADDFWHFIRSGAIPPYLPQANQQNAVVIAALARAAAAYTGGGYHVIVDGIVGPWFIERFCASAGFTSVPIHYLILRPNEATTVQRPQAAAQRRSPAPGRSRRCIANSLT